MVSSGNGTMCWPTVKDSPLCWWVWLLLLLLLLLLCCCCGVVFWQQNRPRVFIRLHKAGTMGHTTEDERLFTVYVKDGNESIQSVVDKLIEINAVPQQVVNQLSYDRTLDLYHQQHHCQISNNSCLSDYDIQPIRSNKAKGKTKRSKLIRFERAVIDIKKGLVTNPMNTSSFQSKDVGSDSTTIEMVSLLKSTGSDSTTIEVTPSGATTTTTTTTTRTTTTTTGTAIGQVELIGAGTHAVDAHYRATPTLESNILAAYVSPTGYRLHLIRGKLGDFASQMGDGKKNKIFTQHNKWKILHPTKKLVLYSVSALQSATRCWFREVVSDSMLFVCFILHCFFLLEFQHQWYRAPRRRLESDQG